MPPARHNDQPPNQQVSQVPVGKPTGGDLIQEQLSTEEFQTAWNEGTALNLSNITQAISLDRSYGGLAGGNVL